MAVNFDAGNFVIYGTDDPVRAVTTLAERIENVHLKDARRSARPRFEYGRSAPLGSGDANIPGVISALTATGYAGPLLVECSSREGGIDAVRTAVNRVREMIR